MRDVFLTFLRLGMTSFGGPIAHLGYFRSEFVDRKRWLDEAAFAQIVALCSVLPGPTSSQVGILIGVTRAGVRGGLAAWVAFTAPSAIAMTMFAFVLGAGRSHATGAASASIVSAAIAGLGLAAVGVVALAVLTLARSLCTDRRTAAVAAGSTLVATLLAARPGWQWLPIALGAAAGIAVMRDAPPLAENRLRIPIGRRGAVVALVLFAVLATSLGTLQSRGAGFDLIAACVRAGSLVFGGGHVILPLLQSLVTDRLVSTGDFFAGYAAAQAVPGPLSTFATFLGFDAATPMRGALGALAGTLAIFLPTFLLLAGIVPFWNAIRDWPLAAAALRGANAAVVGLLAAVLYTPIFTGLVTSPVRFALAVLAFGLLGPGRVPPWIVVIASATFGTLVLRG